MASLGRLSIWGSRLLLRMPGLEPIEGQDEDEEVLNERSRKLHCVL